MTNFKSRPLNVGGPVVIWKDLFTAKELDAIVAHGDALMPMRAEIVGRQIIVSHGTRITRVAWMERKPEIAWLHARLEEIVLAINREFYSFDLYGLVEAFQYTVYDDKEGGHYDWHVDLGGHDVQPRKISMSLQLTDSSEYQGCDLVLQAGSGHQTAERARGTLIAFPSYVLHRVTPCTKGTRKALVCWTTGPKLR